MKIAAAHLRTLIVALLCLAAAAIVGVVLYTSLFTSSTTDKISTKQDVNTARTKQDTVVLQHLSALARQIHSCTTPGEPCAMRGSKATAKVVAQISDNNATSNQVAAAAAAACAARAPHQTFQVIYACTVTQAQALSRAAQPPKPLP